VVVGVLEAVVFAVGLTILDAVRRSARPGDALLGYDAGLGRFVDVAQRPDARVVSGVVVYRLDDRLFFDNARYVMRRMREAVRGAPTTAHRLVLDAESIAHLDTRLSRRWGDSWASCTKTACRSWWRECAPNSRIIWTTSASESKMGAERFYSTVQAAVQACVSEEAGNHHDRA
jgi:sulfate permease, SulP family